MNSRAVVVYALLLMIAYGALVETVHSHGLLSRTQPGVAAVSNAEGSQASRTGHSRLSECSTCQFQQHLYNGLVHSLLFALKPATQNSPVDTPSLVYLSNSVLRTAGRAPPLALG